jgi:hypothetical protein
LAIFTVINGVLLRPLEDRGLTTPGRFNYNYGIQENALRFLRHGD